MTTDPKLDPLTDPDAVAAVANIATIHATLAGVYAAGGDHRAATETAREARSLLDTIADGASIRAGLRLAALDSRVHEDGMTCQRCERDAIDAEPVWFDSALVDAHRDAIDPRLVAALSTLEAPYGARGIIAATEALYPGATPPPQFSNADAAAERDTEGARLVADERWRQIREEGFELEDDLRYDPDTLARAAGSYLMAATADHPEEAPVPGAWPWDAETWKPSASKVRNLVKAAALLVAEVDAALYRERFTDPPSPEELATRSAPTPASMFPCPAPDIAGAEDRCGQFTDPRTCHTGSCSHTTESEARS